MKLLIVDDNHLLVDGLKHQLQASFIVDTAFTGTSALELATAIAYDMIILDLNLPDMAGLQVCETLRLQDIATPIIVSTGIKDADVCVRLFEGGADDYITKPYDLRILQARMQALLRRSQKIQMHEQLILDDLVVDVYQRKVQRGGHLIHLRRKEYDILEYLMHNRGRAVSRTMILNHVWEFGKERWNNTVDVHIKSLRDKIDRPFAKPLIKTAHGIGYMLDTNA